MFEKRLMRWVAMTCIVIILGSNFWNSKSVVQSVKASEETTIGEENLIAKDTSQSGVTEEKIATDSDNEIRQESDQSQSNEAEGVAADESILLTSQDTAATDSASIESSESNDASSESSISADASSESSTVDSAATGSSDQMTDKIIITYIAGEGGTISSSEETVDLTAGNEGYQGSIASAEDGYEFENWSDEDEQIVSENAEFIPQNLSQDTTYTANFIKKNEMPAQSFDQTSSNGIRVEASADEGAFPAGTTMVLTAVADKSAMDIIDSDDIVDVAAVDIAFMDEQGNEIEPANSEKVHVTLTSQNTVAGDDHEIVHIDDNAVVQKVADADANGAEFDAGSFSIYVIVGTSTGSKRESGKYTVLAGQSINIVSTVILDTQKNGNWIITEGSTDASLSNMITSSTTPSTDVDISAKATEGEKIKVEYRDQFSKSVASFEITVTTKVTVTFKTNNGSDPAPASITQNVGETITLPEYTGAQIGFTGWSLNGNANGKLQYSPGHLAAIYKAGDSYTAVSNITFYAIWSEKDVDADFYIRNDCILQYEPTTYPASDYTYVSTKQKTLKTATFVTNTDSDGIVDYLNEGPTKRPTDAEIAAAYKKANPGKIYDPATMYVRWYVIKHESTWHVDGVVLSKEKVTLTYDPNAPAGTWRNMPGGGEYYVNDSVTISSTIPTRTGYVFNGWNMQSNGIGTAYSSGEIDAFSITANTVLYAQWIPVSSNIITTTTTTTTTATTTTEAASVAATPAVLGARRATAAIATSEEPAVLGATRERDTGDTTKDGIRVFVLMICIGLASVFFKSDLHRKEENRK